MKARILDSAALRAISPSALAAFARGEGWTKGDAYGDHADVYSGAGKPEIILPRTERLADYAAVVSKIVDVFAESMERDALAVYRELVGADRDVVRVRAFGIDEDGTVPINAGVRIVEHARDMLLAAACAVRSPQPLYRAGANRDAIDYIRRVRLGQTEHGSYVVTLLAPVPPMLQPRLSPTWVSLDDEPIERQVTRRLVTALEASRNAVELAMSGDGASFERAVEEGVSANLCESVASLIEESNDLEINISWARTRPTPEIRRTVMFSSSDADILREAARTFRQRQPKPDVKLFGTVLKLKRDQEEVEGLVTLKAMVDEKVQSVRAVLDQTNYSVAVRAHEAKTPVIVTGDLERVKQRWQLTNASIMELPVDESADDDSE
ncbi:MAG: hypothetical protein U1E86_18940 [Burkholderiaceae bacterium]